MEPETGNKNKTDKQELSKSDSNSESSTESKSKSKDLAKVNSTVRNINTRGNERSMQRFWAVRRS